MITTFHDYFRCGSEVPRFGISEQLSDDEGFFSFGGSVCYGRCSRQRPVGSIGDVLPEVWGSLAYRDGRPYLPLDLCEVVENLRGERYSEWTGGRATGAGAASASRELYYVLRPLLPVGVRKHLQRMHLRGWERIAFPHWPVDLTVDTLMRQAMALAIRAQGTDRLPFIWFWPEGAYGCAMMTHDVEGERGRQYCDALMDVDDAHGIKSAFQVIPGKPGGANGLPGRIQRRGFEVNDHDWNHDGALFREREEFLKRAHSINRSAKDFGSRGFRSGAMYRNQNWYEALDFSYDMSVPNVAHLEGQRGGCCTVMPYFIGDILELPLTTVQDYSLFHILGDYSTALWRQQIELILSASGIATFIVHPDYLVDERARSTYVELLEKIVELRERQNVWVALPSEVDRWWRNRQAMTLRHDEGRLRIEGPGSERARIAYAVLDGESVSYEVDGPDERNGTCSPGGTS